MEQYEPDMLDDLTAHEAETRPEAVAEWEATKMVALLTKTRIERGLTRAEVAARRDRSLRRVAEIERRPWSANFGRVAAYARAVGAEVGIVGGLPLAA